MRLLTVLVIVCLFISTCFPYKVFAEGNVQSYVCNDKAMATHMGKFNYENEDIDIYKVKLNTEQYNSIASASSQEGVKKRKWFFTEFVKLGEQFHKNEKMVGEEILLNDENFEKGKKCYINMKDKLPKDIVETFKDENTIGFFWNGVESFKKTKQKRVFEVKEVIGYIIIEWSEKSDVNKDILNYALKECPNPETDDLYYHEEDRYRGKAYELIDKKQHAPRIERWAKYVKVYQKAVELSKNPEALQGQLNAVAEELKAAKEELIPKTEINATHLYEMYNRYSGDLYWTVSSPNFYRPTSEDPKIDETNTTPESLERFKECIPKMKALLDSLYDSENKASDINKVSNEQLVAEIKESLKETKAAYEGLERPIYTKMQIELASRVWGDLSTLGNGFFDVKNITKENFTDESYENLKKACENARRYCEGKLAPALDITPLRQTDEMIKLQDEVLKAYYNLREKKDTIKIKLKVIDNVYDKDPKTFYQGDKFYSPYHFEKELVLGEERNYGSVKQILHSDFRRAIPRDAHSAYALFINGVFVDTEWENKHAHSSYLSGRILSVDPNPSTRDICLRDGDEVVLARLRQPTKLNSTGALSEPAFNKHYLDYHIKTSKIKVPKEIVQGEETEFKFEVAPASIVNERRGKYNPMRGAELYVSSNASDDKESISLANKATGVKTDYSGKLKYRFLDPGYYRVSINPPWVESEGDADYMPGLICPSVEEIYVKPTNEKSVEKIKREFLDELKSEYERYPEASYSSEDLQKIKELYASGVDAIEKAEKLIDSAQEKERIIGEIHKIQEKNSIVNDKNIAEFLEMLAPMPDDVSKFDKGQLHLMKKVIEKYDNLSSYQVSLLLKKDKDKYDELKKAYKVDGSTLPEPKRYKITYRIVGDNDEDTKVLEKLFELYEKESKGKNKSSLGAFRNKEFFEGHISHSWKIGHRDAYTGDSFPLQRINATNNSIFESNRLGKYASQVEGAEYKSSGNDAGLYINGKRYYKVEIGYGNSLKLSRKVSGGGLKLQYDAYMPYEDVEIVLICSEDDLKNSNLKIIAKNNIESQFLKYKKEDYTDENWEKLVKAKDDVLQEIDDLQSTYYISNYYDKALRVMAAIPRKTSVWNGTNLDENLSNQELPDFGETVGRVRIIVENQTFKDSTAAWHGKLIDGWYELEERDTMMTSILKALQKKDCHWSTGNQGNASSWDDYTINYLASIKVSEKTKGDGSDFVVNNSGKTLGEFSGTNMSGWMGTLNDWFTNEGFSQFSASSGDTFKKLADGDEIHVMFTQNLGVDLGGSWNNSDTRLKNIEVEGKGILAPVFNPNVKEYVYALKENETSEIIRIKPTAMNKNYLVGMFLNNDQVQDGLIYKRTSNIHVKINDEVKVVVGRYRWPSMNKQGAESRHYTETQYKINVIRDVASYLNSKIMSLPSSKRISLRNYAEYKEQIDSISETYKNISSEDKAKIKNVEVLKTLMERVKFFEDISVVKEKLKLLPNINNIKERELRALKSEIEVASGMYKALTDEQKKYIVIADVENYNVLIEKLKTLKVEVKAESISASKEAPVSTVVEPKAEVKGDKAVAKVDVAKVTQVIKEAAKQGEKKIIIEPTGTKEAKEISVSIPKAAAEAIAEKKDMSVSIETKSGQVSIPAVAMEGIVKEAKGAEISIDISLKKEESVKDEKAKKVLKNKDAVAVEVKIASAGKRITKFSKAIEIMLPVGDKFEVGKNYPVTQISEDGTVSNPVGKCVKIGGKYYIKVSVNHLSTFVVSPEPTEKLSFTDIEGHWAYDAIKYAVEKKLMNGVSDSAFAPDFTLSRAMLTTILYRMEKEPKVVEALAYGDVAKGEWYADAVAWASKEGIVTGYSDSVFAPNDNITREQMAAMLMRYSKYKKMDVSKTKDMSAFKDANSISSWARDAMSWAGATGLVNGRTADTIVPSGTATRAEAATILKRYMENVVQGRKPGKTEAAS